MSRHDRHKELQLAQLRSFCLAATQGSFAEAAETAGISRAAVWQQVRALEQRLGAVLLRRSGRTVALTPDGKLVLDIVLPYVQGLDSLDRLLEVRRLETPPRLAVAAPPAQLSFTLHRPLQQFARTHPNARLNLLSVLRSRQVERQVEGGTADVGVLINAPDEPRSPSLVYEPLFDCPLLLLMAADHPLARKKRIGPEDLAGQPLILAPVVSSIRRTQDRLLRQLRLTEHVHVVLETEHTHIVLQYAALGLGIALWTLHPSAVSQVAGLHGRIFDPTFEALTATMVVRKYARLPELVQDFCQLVRQSVGGQQAGRVK